jgi:hypothetical protein
VIILLAKIQKEVVSIFIWMTANLFPVLFVRSRLSGTRKRFVKRVEWTAENVTSVDKHTIELKTKAI